MDSRYDSGGKQLGEGLSVLWTRRDAFDARKQGQTCTCACLFTVLLSGPVVRLSRRLDRVGVLRAYSHDELSSAHQIRKMTIAPVVDMYVKHLEVEYSI